MLLNEEGKKFEPKYPTKPTIVARIMPLYSFELFLVVFIISLFVTLLTWTL